ncbi:ABC transporter substrate-binding protein [Mesorhizobium sp. M0243]|uniref:ABC transporter substrate-binding protein n=1 Tax=Mesorhizobium sp. M0243 TaxID=2956925 RepID=UPI0033388E1E
MKISANSSKSVAKRIMRSSVFAGIFFASTAMADTLRVIADGDLKTVDPIVTTSGTTLVHAYLIYDKLFEFDKDGVAHPQLADKVDTSADKKSYTITLRKGLKFSDGGPITTDDVLQSLKRWASRDQTGQLLAARLKGMTKLDDLTFRIELTQPFDVPAALAGITGNPAFIMPKRVASLPPTDQLTDTTGSGPYQFDYSSWKPGQTRIYTKNPNYIPRTDPPSFFAGKKEASFDKIEMAYVPDANTAMAEMLTGQQDIWAAPPLDNALALRDNPDLVVAKGFLNQGVVVVNHVVPPFDNNKAREALTYLIDQTEISRAAVGDQEFWHTCYAYLTCKGTYGDESAYKGHRGAADLDKAKELLKEAGYDGKPIVILDPTDWSEAHARALYLGQQLRKVGAEVDLQAMDWSTLTSRRTSKAPASEGGWNLFPNIMEGQPASSPLTHLMLASNCDKAWFGWPCDKKIEDLRAAFISAADQNEKKKIASELQARASVYLPFIVTGENTGAVVYRAELEGFNPETAELYFWNIRRKSK